MGRSFDPVSEISTGGFFHLEDAQSIHDFIDWWLSACSEQSMEFFEINLVARRSQQRALVFNGGLHEEEL